MNKIIRLWVIPVFHAIIIIFVYASPWLIPWRYVLLIVLLYQIQLLVFKGCILTQFQFKNKKEGFNYYYLRKVFPTISHRAVDMAMDYVFPLLLIIIAYLVQTR